MRERVLEVSVPWQDEFPFEQARLGFFSGRPRRPDVGAQVVMVAAGGEEERPG